MLYLVLNDTPELKDHSYQTKLAPPKKLKKSHHAKNALISKLKKKNILLKNKLAALKSGKVSKSLERKIVENALKHKFTPAQIHEILKPEKKLCQDGKRKGKWEITRLNWLIFLIFVS